MKSILELQIAVMNGDKSGIRTVLDEMDRRTENEMFVKAGEHFGFKTIEWNARRITYRPHLAPVFGYSHESGLRQLAERYDLEPSNWGGSVKMCEPLPLKPSRSKPKRLALASLLGQLSSLRAWSQPLPPPTPSSSTSCKQKKRLVSRAGTLEVKRDQSRFDSAARVVNLISKAERIKDQNLRDFALRHIDDLLDGALNLSTQSDLFK